MKTLTAVVLAGILLVMGCREDGGVQESGTFSGTLVAADGSSVALAGPAEFIDVLDETGQPTFLIQLFVGTGADGLRVIMGSKIQRPAPGTFTISAFSDSTFYGTVLQGGADVVFPNPRDYSQSSGELLIEESTQVKVEGTFNFVARGNGPYGPMVTVSGMFSAENGVLRDLGGTDGLIGPSSPRRPGARGVPQDVRQRLDVAATP